MNEPRRGFGTGDVMIALAALSVLVALSLPYARARSFQGRVDAAAEAVDAVVSAAESDLHASGSWPAPAPPGQHPGTMAVPQGTFVGDGYVVEWTRWGVVDSAEATPAEPADDPFDAPPDTAVVDMAQVIGTVGAVRLHSGDPALLGEMLSLYQDRGAFVWDTVWTLVLSERGPG